jgi:hypothetical protein
MASTLQIPLLYCGLEGALDTIDEETDDLTLFFTYNLLGEARGASISPLSGLLWPCLCNVRTLA